MGCPHHAARPHLCAGIHDRTLLLGSRLPYRPRPRPVRGILHIVSVSTRLRTHTLLTMRLSPSSFFALLISYLGGERSLLVLLHGREPTPHPWPISIFCRPLDISDPFSFLFLKRGILRKCTSPPRDCLDLSRFTEVNSPAAC